jgi:NAD(P)H-hydrate repair Nnr-like enzyme with NAD(P)H-hydrate dehydratase domain
LKGAGSLVATSNDMPELCDQGNPGMASAGMGDVLSGVIGGLLAQFRTQGISLAEAAKLGVCLHAMAADRAAAKKGERGMIATDLLPYLRQLMNNLDEEVEKY